MCHTEDVTQVLCPKEEDSDGEVVGRAGAGNHRQACGAEVLAEAPQLIPRGNSVPPGWCRGNSSLRTRLTEERVPACAREQDGEIYGNDRNFLFSHSPPPFHFLLLFWSLSHLLSLPLQALIGKFSPEHSYFECVFLSFPYNICSLIFGIFLAGEADQLNDDNIEHGKMASFTLKPVLLCSSFRYQPFPCLSLSQQTQKLTYHLFSPHQSSPLGREGHSLSYIFNLLFEKA